MGELTISRLSKEAAAFSKSSVGVLGASSGSCCMSEMGLTLLSLVCLSSMLLLSSCSNSSKLSVVTSIVSAEAPGSMPDSTITSSTLRDVVAASPLPLAIAGAPQPGVRSMEPRLARRALASGSRSRPRVPTSTHPLADYWPIIGRLLADYWPIIGRAQVRRCRVRLPQLIALGTTWPDCPRLPPSHERRVTSPRWYQQPQLNVLRWTLATLARSPPSSR
jgi:hypothetical protein